MTVESLDKNSDKKTIGCSYSFLFLLIDTPLDIGNMYVGKYFTEEGDYDEIGFKRDIKKLLISYEQKKYKSYDFNHKSD